MNWDLYDIVIIRQFESFKKWLGTKESTQSDFVTEVSTFYVIYLFFIG